MSTFVITVPDAAAPALLKKIKAIKGVKVKKQKAIAGIDWALPSNGRKATEAEIEKRIKSAMTGKNIDAVTVRKKLDAAIKKTRSKAKAA